MGVQEVNNEWYSNKELFEQLNGIRTDFQELRTEMRETRAIIKEYNGLRKKIELVENEIEELKALKKGQSSVWKGIREWGGWIVAILALVIAYLQ